MPRITFRCGHCDFSGLRCEICAQLWRIHNRRKQEYRRRCHGCGPFLRVVKGSVSQLTITVNGGERRVAPGTTVGALLIELGLLRERVAVERNREIVPKQAYDEAVLCAGDRVEVVALVGGG